MVVEPPKTIEDFLKIRETIIELMGNKFADKGMIGKLQEKLLKTEDEIERIGKYLPNVISYTKYLNIASIRLNLTLDRCRDKFGLYTNEQWFNLFNT